MGIIKDPIKIQYRTALQVERDYQARDLGIVLEEFRVQFQTRQSQGKPPITTTDKSYLLKKVRALANPHLELQFDIDWKNLPPETKKSVIERVTNILLMIALGADESIEGYTVLTAPILLEEILRLTVNPQTNLPATNLVRSLEPVNLPPIVPDKPATLPPKMPPAPPAPTPSASPITPSRPPAQPPAPAAPPTNPNPPANNPPKV